MQNRTPLSKREYYALRQLFGIVSIFHSCGDDLKDRLCGTEGLQEDYDTVKEASDRVCRAVLDTIPANKLQMLQRELNHTVCEINVRAPVGIVNEDAVVCVETGPLERMMDRAMGVECFACEKTGKKARSCPMRKDIARLIPWDFPPVANDQCCPFAGSSIDNILEETGHGDCRQSEDQASQEDL